MTIKWSGRAYIDEYKITKEQYDTFFENGEFNIKLDIANLILDDMRKGESEEVVPCDELKEEFREDIKRAIKNGETFGRLFADGETLDWNWEPELTSEGDTISLSDLDEFALEHIASQMLDNCIIWGIFED